MKKYLVGLFLCLGVNLFAQNYKGIHTSRYLPLQNIYNQPADLVRTDRKWHINVVAPQVVMVNNFAFNESDFVKTLSKVGIIDLKQFFSSDQSTLVGRGQFMLPSVAYKINSKNAVAFSINLRADGIYRSSNDELSLLFTGIDHPELMNALEDEYFKSVINQWTEFAFTWSGVLWHDDTHMLTAGANVKYLVGGGSGYLNLDGIEASYNHQRIDYFHLDVSYALNKSLTTTIDDGKIDFFGDMGLGFDMGLSYSYKPEWRTDIPYRYKIGFLVGDLGYVRQKSDVKNSTFRINIEDVPYSMFEGISSLEALVDTLQKAVGFEEVESQSYKMNLPTTYVLSGDYCFNPKLYLNVLFAHQPGFYKKMGDVIEKSMWKMNVTTRFENEKWGTYLPIDYSTFDFRVGLAFRWKGVFLGSSTFVSNLFKNEKGRGEIYFGINLPIGRVE